MYWRAAQPTILQPWSWCPVLRGGAGYRARRKLLRRPALTATRHRAFRRRSDWFAGSALALGVLITRRPYFFRAYVISSTL